MHRLWSVVYKVDQFVLETLSSSLVLLNIRFIFYLDLSYNTTLGYRLFDKFSDYIFFYLCNCLSLSSCKPYLECLNHLYLKTSSSSTLIVVTDTIVTFFSNMQTISATHFWRLEQQISFSKALAD